MPEVKKEYLTRKQKVALMYLCKGYSPRKVSQLMKVRLNRIMYWITEHELFKNKLNFRLSEFDDKEAIYRRRNNTTFLETVYDELHQRLKKGEITNLETKELFSISKLLSSEIRADSPKIEEKENKIQHVNINVLVNQLGERAKKATSIDVIDTSYEEAGDPKKELKELKEANL